jgi:hypothetical protein
MDCYGMRLTLKPPAESWLICNLRAVSYVPAHQKLSSAFSFVPLVSEFEESLPAIAILLLVLLLEIASVLFFSALLLGRFATISDR